MAATVLRQSLLVLALLFACTGSFAPSSATADDAPARPSASAPAALDLNEATEEQLTALPGIGPSKAAAIVAYRRDKRFRRIEDIMRVRGIGRATFRALRDRLTVAPSEGSHPRP